MQPSSKHEVSPVEMTESETGKRSRQHCLAALQFLPQLRYFASSFTARYASLMAVSI